MYSWSGHGEKVSTGNARKREAAGSSFNLLRARVWPLPSRITSMCRIFVSECVCNAVRFLSYPPPWLPWASVRPRCSPRRPHSQKTTTPQNCPYCKEEKTKKVTKATPCWKRHWRQRHWRQRHWRQGVVALIGATHSRASSPLLCLSAIGQRPTHRSMHRSMHRSTHCSTHCSTH